MGITTLTQKQLDAIRHTADWLITEHHFRRDSAERIANDAFDSISSFYYQYGVYSPKHGHETQEEFDNHLEEYLKEGILKEMTAYTD